MLGANAPHDLIAQRIMRRALQIASFVSPLWKCLEVSALRS